MVDHPPPTLTQNPSPSDDALIARLYELAFARERGCSSAERDELARIDAMVYRRLTRTYAADAPEGDAHAAYRLDS